MEKEKKRWVFIINPVAGNGSANLLIPKLEDMLTKKKIEAEIVFSEHKGHAAGLSSDYYERGTDYIIGVGGDGTLNEIARPLVNKKNVTIGIIPAGTGNDFIQILGFPNRFEEKHWDIFFRAEEKKMDVGLCNGMIFLNGMGLGFDAQVAAENYTEEGNVKKGGGNKYIWHIVKTLLYFREKKMTSFIGADKSETDCFINTIANGRRFAGGFFLTPKALADDGLLDVCMIERLSLFERFSILLMVPKGLHVADRRVNYYQTPGIRLEFPEPVPFHVDGELYFSKEFDVSIMPAAVNTIYNPDGNHFFCH
ncbi:MAG: diacylglycerol kinase family lipid kinase [Bacteroidales bacterium]|nr:diacylglycerol kinase family lipid kinase [Bacteroidales bacterium]